MLKENFIEWRDLTCVFDGRNVIAGISGELLATERLRVKGPSGSGKTTLLRILLGLMQPTSGKVNWAEPIQSLATYVPQEPDFGSSGTVREWINTVFNYRRNRASKPDWLAIVNMLNRLGVGESIVDESVVAISGGEKQRVALAVAMLLPRKVLVLDEPFSALDADATSRVAEALKESGRSIVYASHVDAAIGFSTREIEL